MCVRILVFEVLVGVRNDFVYLGYDGVGDIVG